MVSSRPRPPLFWRISRSTVAGRALCPPSKFTSRCTTAESRHRRSQRGEPRLSAPASEAERARATRAELGTVAPKFVQLTNEVVFNDLWRQPDLSARDRSLVTIAALAAMGDDDQLDVYLRRGLESGLTRAQIAEALTHLGFYAGWPKATKALAAVTKTLGQ